MRRIRRLVAAAAIGLAAGGVFLAAGSVYLAEGALHVPDHSRALLGYGQAFARGAGARAEQVSVRAEDGARLEGWLFTPARPNGAAAIVLHGVGDTRLGVLGQARFLLDAGYMVLTPDSRGHGASGGGMITYGLLESGDIHQWANLLLARPGVERLYGAGQSMGAAILIESLAREPTLLRTGGGLPLRHVPGDRARPGRAARVPQAVALLAGGGVRFPLCPPALWSRPVARFTGGSAAPVAHAGAADSWHGGHEYSDPALARTACHEPRCRRSCGKWRAPEHVASIGSDPAEYARRVTGYFAAHRKVPNNYHSGALGTP